MADLTSREEREKLRAQYTDTRYGRVAIALLDACDTLEQQRDAALDALAGLVLTCPACDGTGRVGLFLTSDGSKQGEKECYWCTQAREVLRAAGRLE